jgi:hypothetical protein
VFLSHPDEEGFYSVASLHCFLFSFTFSLSPCDRVYYSPIVICEGSEGLAFVHVDEWYLLCGDESSGFLGMA